MPIHLGDDYDIYQTIDLNKISGVDLSKDPRLIEEISQAIIDEMVSRTESGQDRFNKAFTKGKYSKEYSETEKFKDYGKSQNDVDMTLTGDMLNDIEVIEQNGSNIKIGFTKDVNKLKAANHNNGVTVPKRPFFGVLDKRIEEILNEQFSDEIEAIKNGSEQQTEKRTTAAELFGERFNANSRQLFDETFGGLFFGES